jgi:hypothetical protein
VAKKLELPLRDGGFGEVLFADELAPSCRDPRPDWRALIPEALTAFERLEAIADLSSAGEPVASGRQRSLLQASELLLHALVGAGGGGGESPELAVREYARLRVQEALRRRFDMQEEALHQRFDMQEEAAPALACRKKRYQRLGEAAEATEVLRQIESSQLLAGPRLVVVAPLGRREGERVG